MDTSLGPGSTWLTRQGIKLSPLGQKVADLLDDLYKGIYHIESQALKVDWQHTQLISIVLMDGNFSTYDSDGLTRLVFLCHEHNIRVSVRGAAHHYLRLHFMEVDKNGFFREGHPTLIDVLIVNPRKVETGLDLIAFSSIYVYEPELSPYSLWQALRRIWRPGQTQDCKIKFMVYTNTMEHKAVRTLLKRMGSVLLLYGDEPGGALATLDEGNILLELTRAALKELDGEAQPDTEDDNVGLSISLSDMQDSIWLSLPAPTEPVADIPNEPLTITIDQTARMIWKAVMEHPKKRVPEAQLSFLDMMAAAD